MAALCRGVLHSHVLPAVRRAGGMCVIDTDQQEHSHKWDHAVYRATSKQRAGLDIRMDRHIQRQMNIAEARRLHSDDQQQSSVVEHREAKEGTDDASVSFRGRAVQLLTPGGNENPVGHNSTSTIGQSSLHRN